MDGNQVENGLSSGERGSIAKEPLVLYYVSHTEWAFPGVKEKEKGNNLEYKLEKNRTRAMQALTDKGFSGRVHIL